jgi:hypothetical protein
LNIFCDFCTFVLFVANYRTITGLVDNAAAALCSCLRFKPFGCFVGINFSPLPSALLTPSLVVTIAAPQTLPHAGHLLNLMRDPFSMHFLQHVHPQGSVSGARWDLSYLLQQRLHFKAFSTAS